MCFFCSGPVPGGGGLLSGQELSWLVAVLYNVGVELYGEGQYQAAALPLLVSASASICCLAEAVLDGADEQVGLVVWDKGQRLLTVGPPWTAFP